MEDRIIVLTFRDYLTTVKFMGASRKDQVAYLMYYIIHIARLRDDMLPAVIADRINDQIVIENNENDRKLKKATTEEIEKILQENPDFFAPSSGSDYGQSDRKKMRQDAFVLSAEKMDALSEKFSTKFVRVKKQLKKRNLLNWIFGGILLCCVVAVLLSWKDSRNIAKQLSWDDFVKYSQVKEANYDYQCLFLLYHITEDTELNPGMVPKVLSDRIVSLGCISPGEEAIADFLVASDLVRSIPEGYRLSVKGKQAVEDIIETNYKNSNMVTLRWAVNNLRLEAIVTILMVLVGCFTAGVSFGKSQNF